MTSVVLVMTIAQARIFFAMARDGLLPPFFGRVHPRFRTPSAGTAITGFFAAPIPHAVADVRLHCWCRRVRNDDGVARACYLVAAGDLDRYRCVDLRLLR